MSGVCVVVAASSPFVRHAVGFGICVSLNHIFVG